MIRIDKVNENLIIKQRSDGLLFGTDALLLASFMKRSPKAVAVEFGSGSGIISLLCAKKGFFQRIYAVELQRECFELLEENIAQNGLSDRVTPLLADVSDVKQSDFGGEVDVVFANPPYMEKGSGKESPYPIRNISRSEECGGLALFCESASRILRSGGLFYAVYRPERLSHLFASLKENRLEPKRMVLVCPRPEAPPCLVLIEAKKDASPSLMLPKIFCLKHADGSDTVEMSHTLEKGEFPNEYTDRQPKK